MSDKEGRVLSGTNESITYSLDTNGLPVITQCGYGFLTNTFDDGHLIRSEMIGTTISDQKTNTFRTIDMLSWTNHRVAEEVYEADFNGDGKPDSRSITTWTYDSDDSFSGFTTATDWDGDGVVDSTTRTSYVLDRKGIPIFQMDETDWGADGKVDYVTETVFVYDHWRNNTVDEITSYAADGTVLEKSATLYDWQRRSEVTHTSDPSQNSAFPLRTRQRLVQGLPRIR